MKEGGNNSPNSAIDVLVGRFNVSQWLLDVKSGLSL